MKESILTASPLFRGTTQEEIKTMLTCLKAREKCYPKGAAILRTGDVVHELGIVMSGSVIIENDDLWGNKTILDRLGPGLVFAETYACIQGEAMMVNVIAGEPSVILFLDIGKILQTCSSACVYHAKLIHNLLTITAQKNLRLSRRSFHTAPKSIRGRVLSYLSFQAIQQGNRSFYIPFNRQQLADYLNVDRSALSGELSRMQKDGLITMEKNHFVMLGSV